MPVLLMRLPGALLNRALRFAMNHLKKKPEDRNKRDNGDDGDGGPPGLHPFVQGLLKELPMAGDVWPEEQRKLWLDTAASIFKMIYKDQTDTPLSGSPAI